MNNKKDEETRDWFKKWQKRSLFSKNFTIGIDKSVKDEAKRKMLRRFAKSLGVKCIEEN